MKTKKSDKSGVAERIFNIIKRFVNDDSYIEIEERLLELKSEVNSKVYYLGFFFKA